MLFSLLALEFLPSAMPLSLAKAVPLSNVLSVVLPIATPASTVSTPTAIGPTTIAIATVATTTAFVLLRPTRLANSDTTT